MEQPNTFREAGGGEWSGLLGCLIPPVPVQLSGPAMALKPARMELD